MTPTTTIRLLEGPKPKWQRKWETNINKISYIRLKKNNTTATNGEAHKQLFV